MGVHVLVEAVWACICSCKQICVWANAYTKAKGGCQVPFSIILCNNPLRQGLPLNVEPCWHPEGSKPRWFCLSLTLPQPWASRYAQPYPALFMWMAAELLSHVCVQQALLPAEPIPRLEWVSSHAFWLLKHQMRNEKRRGSGGKRKGWRSVQGRQRSSIGMKMFCVCGYG